MISIEKVRCDTVKALNAYNAALDKEVELLDKKIQQEISQHIMSMAYAGNLPREVTIKAGDSDVMLRMSERLLDGGYTVVCHHPENVMDISW